MRTIQGVILAWLLVYATGCELAKIEEPKRSPLAPSGVLPGGGGDAMNPPPATQAANPPAAAQPAPAAAAPARTADGKGIIGKSTAIVVNAKDAKQNPNVKEVENKVSGSDPLTVAASAYVAMRSKPQILAFQATLRQIKEGEGRIPTFEEFTTLMEENRITFVELYPWQMYGYDPDTGSLVVLEDSQKKAEIYKAAGLNPDGE